MILSCHKVLAHAVEPALSMALIALLAACQPLSTISPSGDEVRHYFGYMRVLNPASHSLHPGVSALDISGVGVRIANGLLLGAFREKEVEVPLDCHFVMLVANKQQLEQALATLTNTLRSEDLCLAVMRQ
jgi:hypothetical protein